MDRQDAAADKPWQVLRAEKLEVHAIKPDGPGVGRQPKVAILILQHILDTVLRQTFVRFAKRWERTWRRSGPSGNGSDESR